MRVSDWEGGSFLGIGAGGREAIGDLMNSIFFNLLVLI